MRSKFSHNVSLTSYRLTSLWFHVNRPFHSWDKHFQNLTLKIQGQGHSSRSKSMYSYGQKACITPYRLISLSFHVDRPSHSWVTAISKFDVENSRSRSWVRSKLKVTTRVQHSVDSHPFHSMSIGHPIPQLRLFQNLTLKIKGQGHGWGHSTKSQCGSCILSTHISFVQCQSALPFLIQHFRYLTLKIQGQGQMTMVLHNYRSRQFHRTSNGINPSSGFRDMGSAKSGPNAAWFDKFLTHGQAHMGQMGK